MSFLIGNFNSDINCVHCVAATLGDDFTGLFMNCPWRVYINIIISILWNFQWGCPRLKR